MDSKKKKKAIRVVLMAILACDDTKKANRLLRDLATEHSIALTGNAMRDNATADGGGSR